MNFPEDLKYTKEHEWVRLEGNVAVVGITEFAQAELGDLVFVELPAVGREVAQLGTMCVVESTKAASDVYSPLTGKVKEVNGMLKDDPGLINRDPYNSGWIVKLTNVSQTELGSLMTAAQYRNMLGK